MRIRILGLVAASILVAGPALACGPDALGVSRTLAVGTMSGGFVGLKTYPRTLALAPREVVLTFDDGPMRGRTDKVLAILAAECTKATFFMVGKQAAAAPDVAAAVYRAGHTVAYHSMTHPILRKLTPAAARAEIDDSFRTIDKAVYGVAGAEPQTPFFRFPGFADSPELNQWLTRRGIAVFGADLWASDWLPQTPEAELKLVMTRLEKSNGGILLLHDIQPRTVAMLPQFLRALKLKGFRVVHIVPGRGTIETRPAAPGWKSETETFLSSAPKAVRPIPVSHHSAPSLRPAIEDAPPPAGQE